MSQFISLTQYQLIEVQGADVEKYLQGQLTSDVVRLASGATTLTAHCDPKGKMNAIYRLFKVSSEQFFLLVKKDILSSGLDALKKYAVFSKVSFDLRDWQIIGVIGEKCGKITPHFSLEIDEQRSILLNETELPVNFNGDEKIWEVADIQAGLPNLSPQTQNEFIPQALNLQAVEQAISFTKGCYIGQETVHVRNIVGQTNVQCLFLKRKLSRKWKLAVKSKCSLKPIGVRLARLQVRSI